MIRRSLLLSLALLSAGAQAGATCPTHPRSTWMPLDTLRQQLTGAGYQIKILKVDGQCYELYGRDKAGRKVEIYFDTVTGKPVKSRAR